MDDAVKRWTLQGHVYLWRYQGVGVRHYPGWHLTADAPGCTSMLELIDLMHASPFAGRASVPLTAPGDRELSVPNAGLPHTAAASFELYHSPTKVPPAHWRLVADDGRVRLEAGREALAEVRRGIADVARHEGDYSIGADGQELWFWWFPGARRGVG